MGIGSSQVKEATQTNTQSQLPSQELSQPADAAKVTPRLSNDDCSDQPDDYRGVQFRSKMSKSPTAAIGRVEQDAAVTKASKRKKIDKRVKKDATRVDSRGDPQVSAGQERRDAREGKKAVRRSDHQLPSTPQRDMEYVMEDPSTQLREDIRRAREREAQVMDDNHNSGRFLAKNNRGLKEAPIDEATKSNKRKRKISQTSNIQPAKKTRNEQPAIVKGDEPPLDTNGAASVDLAKARRRLEKAQEKKRRRERRIAEADQQEEVEEAEILAEETAKSKKKVKNWLSSQPTSSQEMLTPSVGKGKRLVAEDDEHMDSPDRHQKEEAAQEDGKEYSPSEPVNADKATKAKTPAKRKSVGHAPADTPKAGAFTSHEIDTVHRAYKRLAKSNKLHESEMNELIQSSAQAKEGVRNDLYAELMEELPHRTRRAIRKFCTRKYSNFHRGRWNDEEDERLLGAYEEQPNKWKYISEKLGRMPEDCRDRWRNVLQYGNARNTDVWSAHEEQMLEQAAMECMTALVDSGEISADDPLSYDKISWPTVAKKLGGRRNRLQCFNKWNKMQHRIEKRERELVHSSDDEGQQAKPAPKSKKKKEKRRTKTIQQMQDSTPAISSRKTLTPSKSFTDPIVTARERYKGWIPGDKYAILLELNDAVNEVSLENQPVFWSYVAEKYSDSPWTNDDREFLYKTMRKQRKRTADPEEMRNAGFQDHVLYFLEVLRSYHGKATISINSKRTDNAPAQPHTNSRSLATPPATGHVDDVRNGAASVPVPQRARTSRPVNAKVSARNRRNQKSEEFVVESDVDDDEAAGDADHDTQVPVGARRVPGRGIVYDGPFCDRTIGSQTTPDTASSGPEDEKSNAARDYIMQYPEERNPERENNYEVEYGMDGENSLGDGAAFPEVGFDDEIDYEDGDVNQQRVHDDQYQEDGSEDDDEQQALDYVVYPPSPQSHEIPGEVDVEQALSASAETDSDAGAHVATRNSRSFPRAPSPELVLGSPYRSPPRRAQAYDPQLRQDEADQSAFEASDPGHTAYDGRRSTGYRAIKNSSYEFDDEGRAVVLESDQESLGGAGDVRQPFSDTDEEY